MKKLYLIIVTILIGFILVSTTCFAASIGLSSTSDESDQVVVEGSDSYVEVETPDSNQQTNNDVVIKTDNQESESYVGNIPPVADFSYRQDGYNKFWYYFNDSSIDPDGEVVYWQWNFNDGTPNSTCYEQNPQYDFEHVAGHDITVLLLVGDNGVPQEFGAVSKVIHIPSDVSLSNEICITPTQDSIKTYIYSQSKLSINSIENNLIITINKMTKIFSNSEIFSKIINVYSHGIGPCLVGGECNLYIRSASYTPENPTYNSYIYFSVRVGNKYGEYSGTVEIQVVIEDLDIYYPFSIPFDDQSHDVFFKWPEGAAGSDVIIWVYPAENQGWIEIDMSDNSYRFSNIGNIGTPNLINYYLDETLISGNQASVSNYQSDKEIVGSTNYGTYNI